VKAKMALIANQGRARDKNMTCSLSFLILITPTALQA
jgi:hypothetical protein